MNEQETASDLKLVGKPRQVILGTYSVGNDAFGEFLPTEMEFAGDQPELIS